jgi:anti-sigma regulatory factor (Ser/Thr protein kinase)
MQLKFVVLVLALGFSATTVADGRRLVQLTVRDQGLDRSPRKQEEDDKSVKNTLEQAGGQGT